MSASNLTGTTPPPRPPIAISPLRLHPPPETMNNNSPAELWIVAFKGLLAYLLLSSEEVQSEALAVLLQAEAAEEENVEELISDWTNERATDVDERRHRRAIDCFEDMLEAYMVLTGDP